MHCWLIIFTRTLYTVSRLYSLPLHLYIKSLLIDWLEYDADNNVPQHF